MRLVSIFYRACVCASHRVPVALCASSPMGTRYCFPVRADSGGLRRLLVRYGLKHLIDIIAAVTRPPAVLCSLLVAAAYPLWRVAGWAAAYTFVAVTGDIRRDLFGHLSGQCQAISPSACPARWPARASPRRPMPYSLTENTRSLGRLPPPAAAVVCSIVFIGSVNLSMAARWSARPPAGRGGVLPGSPRHTAASQLRLEGRGRRRRTGGHNRTHVRRARVRRDVPRAEACRAANSTPIVPGDTPLLAEHRAERAHDRHVAYHVHHFAVDGGGLGGEAAVSGVPRRAR